MDVRINNGGLFVVVPFFNEEGGMAATLESLAAQTDRDFRLVLVDNGSTDKGPALARRFAQRNKSFPVYVVQEATRGTGAAADTGFRFAIGRGAQYIARTDADCLPDPDWTRNLKAALCGDGLEFVAGRILPREDEVPMSAGGRIILAAMLWVAETYGKLRPDRRGSRFLYPYFLAVGNNLAISASLYERSGGFPRSRLEELNEDRVLSEKVRTLTTRAAKRDDIVVRNSVRRLRAYGVVNTLRWYRNRGFRPEVVDIR